MADSLGTGLRYCFKPVFYIWYNYFFTSNLRMYDGEIVGFIQLRPQKKSLDQKALHRKYRNH